VCGGRGRDVFDLLTLRDCVAAVEGAFRLHADGRTLGPGVPSVPADARTGTPLALMDSGSVTALRTGAATAVAAKFSARHDARSATVVGCAVQGELQLAALAAVLPLRYVWALDTDPARAQGLAPGPNRISASA
jgi:Ornithine cyclodeaminase/mu-crystallin family